MKRDILKTLEGILLVNREDMTPAEIEQVEKQISYMKNLIFEEQSRVYVKQLKAFSSHMSSEYEKMMCDGTVKTRDEFYSSDFTITFRGKTVDLHMGADVFSHIEEIILYEISEYETEEEIENASI